VTGLHGFGAGRSLAGERDDGLIAAYVLRGFLPPALRDRPISRAAAMCGPGRNLSLPDRVAVYRAAAAYPSCESSAENCAQHLQITVTEPRGCVMDIVGALHHPHRGRGFAMRCILAGLLDPLG